MNENPFSTRFVNPTTCQFVDRQLPISKLANSCPWICQISGPHGSGKTSLAYEVARRWIVEELIDSYQAVVLRGKEVHYPGNSQTQKRASHSQNHLLIVDGVESVSWIQRNLMFAVARGRKIRVLVTTHKSLKLIPVLYQLEPSLGHFQELVDQLQKGSECKLARVEIQRAYGNSTGNYRLALMELYDRWEAKRPKTQFNAI